MNEKEIRSMGEEIGKYLSLGIAGGLVDNSKEALQAFRGFYEKLKYQRDFDLISEEEYYTQLEALRDRYFAVGTDNWVRYTEKIYSYQKKTFETEKREIQNLYDDVAQYATKKLDEVMKKQQNLADKLNDSGALFKVNKVKIGDSVDYYYSLGDMKRDIEQVKRYGEDFEKLSQRLATVSQGAGAGLLDKIKTMDFEDASGYMRALLNSTDMDFAEYVKAQEIKEKLSQNIAAGQYEEEFNDGWEEAYNNMREKLSCAGYEIPEGFSVSGSISAEKFGQAFIEGLDLQLAAVRERIDEFNANLMADVDISAGGNTYNTSNTSYNITTQEGEDIVDVIRRQSLIRRLAGLE